MSDSLGSRPKLRRLKAKGWIGGVCAGFGYWIGIPTWLVRLIWTVMVLAYGVGAILYILLWIFMPVWESSPPRYDERAGG
jgi:phage shock protein PspC (stress-responsive transcriptional regulator)